MHSVASWDGIDRAVCSQEALVILQKIPLYVQENAMERVFGKDTLNRALATPAVSLDSSQGEDVIPATAHRCYKLNGHWVRCLVLRFLMETPC